MPEETPRASWEIDRKVPLAIILTILGQFVLGIWMFSGMYSRLTFLEAQMTSMQTNYAVLNTAREAGALAQAKTDTKVDEAVLYLKSLTKRSDVLHPEFQDDPRVKP